MGGGERIIKLHPETDKEMESSASAWSSLTSFIFPLLSLFSSFFPHPQPLLTHSSVSFLQAVSVFFLTTSVSSCFELGCQE